MASCQHFLDQIPSISQGYYSYNIEWTVDNRIRFTRMNCSGPFCTATIAMTSIWYTDIIIVKFYTLVV